MVFYTITSYTWYMVLYTIAGMVSYTITRYTWFCTALSTWLCIPSLVIQSFVYHCIHGCLCIFYKITRHTWFCITLLVIHGFVYHHSLCMVLYTIVNVVSYTIHMVLYTNVCYKRFYFRCVMWILNHASVLRRTSMHSTMNGSWHIV